MLQVSNLYKKYKTKDSLFELNVNLEIPTPSFVVITGESGSGKSTFAKILAGLISMNHGKIKLNDEDITHKLNNYVEYLEAKEPLIDNFTVYQTLYAKCFHLYDEQEVVEKINNVLELLQLVNLADAKIHDLSGGEAQRVAVGCLLLSSKPILILDEATHSLDEANSEIIVNILKEIRNKTIIYITHKPGEIEGVGDIYYQFESGKIVKEIVENKKEDQQVEISSYNHTRILPIVKNSFFTGIKGHIQTSISYLILFFLCSCFLAIGTFCMSINNESVLSTPRNEYLGSVDSDEGYGVCTAATKYFVEVHSSYNRKVYKDEIEELKVKFQAVDAIENLPLHYAMLPDENGTYSLHLGAFQEKDIVAGRLYKGEKEAVLAINETSFYTNRKYYKSFVGKKYGEYTIVGIVLTPYDSVMRVTYFASIEDCKRVQDMNSLEENSLNFSFSDPQTKREVFRFNKEEFSNCFIDNSLPNDTIATSKISETKKLNAIYSLSNFYRCNVSLDCISSEHLLSMNQATYDKFVDESLVPCTYFYFNTFEACESFIQYLNSQNIEYSFRYYSYNQTIHLLCYLGAFILILGVYILVGIINRKLNRNRDLFYAKCNYNKKKQWFANVMSGTALVFISLLAYILIYAILSQLKYLSVITYYALRWMNVTNGFILIGIALILHIMIEMILQSIPRKRAR